MTTSQTPDETTVRSLQPDDEGAVLALFGQVYGKPKPVQAFRRQLTENPYLDPAVESFPAGLGFVGGALAGYYAIDAVPAVLDGGPVLAGQAVDAMVDPGLRRRGLFGRVVESAHHTARAHDVRLVYGIPNQISAPALLKFGFASPLRLRRRVRHWSPLRALVSRIRRRRPRPLPMAGPENDPGWQTLVEDCWTGQVNRLAFAVERSAAAWTYRYAHRPDRPFHIGPDRPFHIGPDRPFHIGPDRPFHIGMSEGGAYVLAFEQSGRRRTAKLCDLMADDLGAVESLLGVAENAARRARDSGADSLSCWCIEGSPLDRALDRAGFGPRPGGFPLDFIRLDGGEVAGFTPNSVFMMGTDFDIV